MPAAAPSLPDNLRLYVIGDIHGRVDLLTPLLEKIDRDAKKSKAKTRKIFLGDYVDRGLYSRQVIDHLIDLRAKEPEPPVFLLGNHEQVMRELLHGRDGGLLADWLRFGGRETLLSYGVSSAELAKEPAAVIAALREKIAPSHIDFIEKLETSAVFGDYFFCHAGVRPGIDLAKQAEQDLVWIRYDFLAHAKPFGKMVVHGHTISPQPEFRTNRINIDTGAYATGCLTALGLEGKKQWLLQTK
jgi:serine/threonine protein phosphatase 1